MELHDLDPLTRNLMVVELDRDLAGKGLFYLCPRLTERGRADWPLLLRLALGKEDAGWLAEELQRHGRMNQTEQHPDPAGGTRVARVPVNAATQLAEGELNRYYVRAVCRRAIDAGHGVVEVYRAKAVQEPRPASQGQIGRLLNARTVLTELRWCPSDVVPPCGVPGGPSSGISVRLPGPDRPASPTSPVARPVA